MNMEIENDSFTRLHDYCLNILADTAKLFSEGENFKKVRLFKYEITSTINSNYDKISNLWKELGYSKTRNYDMKLCYTHTAKDDEYSEIKVEYSPSRSCFNIYDAEDDLLYIFNSEFIEQSKSTETAQEIYNNVVASLELAITNKK
jgi:hypothetical protein